MRSCFGEFFAYAVLAALVGVGPGAGAEEIRLVTRGVEGTQLVVDVVATDFDGVGSMDLTVEFDPSQLAAPQMENGPLTLGTMVVDNPNNAGRYRIGLIAPSGVSGDGRVATLRFPVSGSGTAPLALSGKLTNIDGAPLAWTGVGTVSELAAGPAATAGGAGAIDPAPEAIHDPVRGPAPSNTEPELPFDVAAAPSGVGGRAAVPTAAPTSTGPGETADASSDALAVPAPDLSDPEANPAPDLAAEVEDFSAPSPAPEDAAPISAIGERAATEIGGELRAGEESLVEIEPDDPLRQADIRAKLDGYKAIVRFEPEHQVEAGPTTRSIARLYVYRHGRPLQVAEADLDARAEGASIRRVTHAPDAVEIELDVDNSALPAYVDLRVLGLRQRQAIPVYPEFDVDVDASGELDRRDLDIMGWHVGSIEGDPRYDPKFDLIRDGTIDDDDYRAFSFMLIERERARRLEKLAAHPTNAAETSRQ